MKEKLLEILEDLLPEVEIGERDDLVSSGEFSSLGILNLISDLEDEFGVNIPVSEVRPENFDSLEAIIKLVERNK